MSFLRSVPLNSVTSSDINMDGTLPHVKLDKTSSKAKFSADNCDVRIKMEEFVPNDVLLQIPKMEPLEPMNECYSSQFLSGTNDEVKIEEFVDLRSAQDHYLNNPLENKDQDKNWNRIPIELKLDRPNIKAKIKIEIECPTEFNKKNKLPIEEMDPVIIDEPKHIKEQNKVLQETTVNSEADYVVATIDNISNSKKPTKKRPTTKKEHKCGQCNFSFLHYPSLYAHKRQAHSSEPFVKSKLPEIYEKHIPQNLENTQQCDVCQKVFCSRQSLKLHISTIHDGIRAFVCKLCPLKFSMKTKLLEHERIHTGEKPYVCGICNRRFAQRGNMNKHIKRHEQAKKQQINKIHECDICKKVLKKDFHLKMHLAAVHQGIRPFVCQFCPSKFTQKPHLQAHERIHTGETPFSCDICDRQFSQLRAMKIHRKKHENKSINEVFKSHKNSSQNKSSLHSNTQDTSIDEIPVLKIECETNNEIEIKMEFESSETELNYINT